MDKTQLTASIAGLALVAASVVGAVVATQGSSDAVVSDDMQAPTEAVLIAESAMADGDVETYAEPAEEHAEYEEDEVEYEEEGAEYEEDEVEYEEEGAGYEEHDEYEEDDGDYEDHEDDEEDEDDD